MGAGIIKLPCGVIRGREKVSVSRGIGPLHAMIAAIFASYAWPAPAREKCAETWNCMHAYEKLARNGATSRSTLWMLQTRKPIPKSAVLLVKGLILA